LNAFQPNPKRKPGSYRLDALVEETIATGMRLKNAERKPRGWKSAEFDWTALNDCGLGKWKIESSFYHYNFVMEDINLVIGTGGTIS
jgi:hypothetical protein